MARIATPSVRQIRRDQRGLGPIEPHTGRSWFLMSRHGQRVASKWLLRRLQQDEHVSPETTPQKLAPFQKNRMAFIGSPVWGTMSYADIPSGVRQQRTTAAGRIPSKGSSTRQQPHAWPCAVTCLLTSAPRLEWSGADARDESFWWA